MSKSLDTLLASPSVGLPECTYELCLSQPLRAKVERLDREIEALEAQQARRDAEGNVTGPPRKSGEGVNPRLKAARAEREAAQDEVREHSGTLLFRAEEAGKWQRWKDANPARRSKEFNQDGRPAIVEDDEAHTYGRCNASALLARLGDFVVSWNDEPISADQWQKLASVAGPGALLKCVSLVVGLHEGEGILAIPFSYSASSTTDVSATV